jgi:hypothetical protein
MKNAIISIQRGLDNYKEALEKAGYEVYYSGHDNNKATVAIISDIDVEYEDMNSGDCRPSGDTCKLVLDVTSMSPDEVVRYINNKECGGC